MWINWLIIYCLICWIVIPILISIGVDPKEMKARFKREPFAVIFAWLFIPISVVLIIIEYFNITFVNQKDCSKKKR
jgi:hypothetical protein